jgi:hypothetical protein
MRRMACSPNTNGNMSGQTIQPHFAASDAVVEWCLRNALRMERFGELEHAGLWAYVAAGTAVEFGHSYLCSAALESLLARIGGCLPDVPSTARAASAPRGKRWLHVLSLTGAIGGHTALVRRWVARNPICELHSVVLTVQTAADIEPGLSAAVHQSGGTLYSLGGTSSLFQRAAALRRLASEQADVVVIHAHPWDVVPSIAFAVPGGPPVLLVNHADHAFWVGTAIADIVVDIRDSGLALSTSLRGPRGSAVLPVPLEDHGPARRDRRAAAVRLGDPSLLARSIVLLTIGSPHKYRSAPNLDFAETIVRIVSAMPDCALIAVGPRSDDEPWPRLTGITGSRVVAVGLDADLAPWHAAADLYLESFPIGSYTALLEIALAERAFVRKPLLAPASVLPIDRGALAAFEPPADADAYVAAAVALAVDPDRRAAQAQEARRAVLAEHCGDGWNARLDALQRVIPRQHDVGLAFDSPPMPGPLAEYRAGIHAGSVHQSPLTYAVQSARQQGLRPRFDVPLVDAMRKLGVAASPRSEQG